MMAAYLGNRSFSVLFVEGITLLLARLRLSDLRTMSGRSTQKRTMADLADRHRNRSADKPTPTISTGKKPGRARALSRADVYQRMPREDRLRHEFRYEAWKDHYAIASAGMIGSSRNPRRANTVPAERPISICDIVYRDGGFVVFRKGAPEGLNTPGKTRRRFR